MPVRAEPTFEFPFQSRVNNLPASPAGTISTASPSANSAGAAPGPPVIVRLPPVAEIVDSGTPDYGLPTTGATDFTPAPDSSHPRWDDDDYQPGSIDPTDKPLSKHCDLRLRQDADWIQGIDDRVADRLSKPGFLSIDRNFGGEPGDRRRAGQYAGRRTIHAPLERRAYHQALQATRRPKTLKAFSALARLTIPIFVVAAFSGPFLEESMPAFGPIGQWGKPIHPGDGASHGTLDHFFQPGAFDRHAPWPTRAPNGDRFTTVTA